MQFYARSQCRVFFVGGNNMNHEKFMKRAIALAKKGRGYVNPNPMVGAVIVKEGEIIGEGYHHAFGAEHAEINALKKTSSPSKATMYVTLEPCSHYGKTPPCCDAIIQSGIKSVFIGTKDPNPLVAGQGIQKLKQHGIDVKVGLLEDECVELNKVFFHYIKTKKPYVTLKTAMTLDGKIATRTGQSKWITGEQARTHVQSLRHSHSAIMVGIGTVLADNPMLTCRLKHGKNPTRIICDTHLKIPLSSKIAQTASNVPTIIAASYINNEKAKQLKALGCQLISTPTKDGRIDLNALMLHLGQMDIDSLLLEGGAELNYSALQAGIVNQVIAYIAPKIFGGITAKSPVGGIGEELPSDCFKLSPKKIRSLGDDLMIEYEVK